jgi:hypothetical protein
MKAPDWRLVFLSAPLAANTATASAADLPLPSDPVEVVSPALGPEWSVTIAAYFWAAGIEGDMAVFGFPAVEVDESFKDILDTLEFGAMTASEIRYGRFGFFSDIMYAKTSDASGTPRGILADSVELGTETLTLTGMADYRLVETPRGSVDAMAGARLWWSKTELSFDGGILDGVDADDEESWVDPMVGVKGRFNITPKVYLNGWAMAGGFGVASDFAWDLLGGVGYQFNDTFSAVLGYRALGVDYENGDFVYDIIQHGPITGLVIRF